MLTPEEKKWLAAAKIESGPVFTPVDKAGKIGSTRLMGRSVNVLVKD